MPARRTVMIVAAALVLGTAAGGQVSGQAEALLQKAIQAETVDGNLKAAIALYERAVAAAGGNRAVAARALVQMGQCYEKLGSVEAQKAYQRVVRDFADQAEPLNLARSRLAALLNATGGLATKPSFQQIRVASTLAWLPQLSPDGSKLAFVNKGALWLLPMRGKVDTGVAGIPEKLPVSLPEGVQVDRDGLAWSADGKWIAFNDLVPSRREGPSASGIYVVSAAGGMPRKLSATPERGELSVNYRLGLSSDGKQAVFASMQRESGELHLETVPVQGDPARRVTGAMGSEPAYSPNGRLIAYAARPPERTTGDKNRLDRSPGGIWVIPTEGGTPVLVADVKSQASYPAWSPDGGMIAFTAGDAVWVVPVSREGKPTAVPTKFVPPHPLGGPLLGWTTDDKIGLLLQSPRYAAVYTVPASGGQAAQVTPEGLWFSPKWAPDGKTIFLRGDGGHVSSVPADGGRVSAIPWRSAARVLEPNVGGENAVSPDGRTIVFAAVKDGAPGVHLWTIPIEGGEPKQLTAGQSETLEDRFPCWSSDGRWIAFVRGERLGRTSNYANVNIHRIPSEGGDPRPLTTASDGVGFGSMAWSPDGNSVAYFSAQDHQTLKVKSLQTGMSRVVGKTELPGWNSLAWSPNGKKLAFTPSSNVKGPFSRIRIISLEDGATVTLETGLPEADYWHVSWSPDGSRLAFAAIQGGEPELWLMEGFLPLIAKGR